MPQIRVRRARFTVTCSSGRSSRFRWGPLDPSDAARVETTRTRRRPGPRWTGPSCCCAATRSPPGCQAALTLTARAPLGFCSTSNSTFSPPERRSKSSELSSESRWKKYSLPSSPAMKPNPRSEMTYFTEPVATIVSWSLLKLSRSTHGRLEKNLRPHGPSTAEGALSLYPPATCARRGGRSRRRRSQLPRRWRGSGTS